MTRKLHTVGLLLALLLLAPSLALAAREGRLIGKVLDPAGEPIEGVTVVATSDEVTGYREVETTDRKGVFKFDFPRRFVTYVLRFEKDGFQGLESRHLWELEGTTRLEFTLQPGQTTVEAGVIASTSNQAITAFNAGVLAFNAQDWPTAEARFQEALEHDPELHQAWGALSKVYLEQERAADAVAAAEKAIAFGSTDESIWRCRWEGYRALGDEAKAAAALEDLESAGVRAEEARRIYNEGVALLKGGDAEAAFARFEEAIVVDPNLHEALLAVATTGYQVGRHAEAATAAETVLNADPDNEQALRARFNAVLELGDEERLIEALVGIGGIEPEVARNGLLKLALEAYDVQDYATARERFLRVLEVDPDHALSHYYVGVISLNLGDRDPAQQHLARFIELAPGHEEAATAAELLEYLKRQ